MKEFLPILLMIVGLAFLVAVPSRTVRRLDAREQVRAEAVVRKVTTTWTTQGRSWASGSRCGEISEDEYRERRRMLQGLFGSSA